MIRLAIFLAISGFMFPSSIYPGAWTQDARHGQWIMTFSYFETSRSYDSSGSVRKFQDNGSYRQAILNSYLEYGLSARSTLVLNGEADFLRYHNDYGRQESNGLGNIEVAIRQRLNATKSPWAVSAQLAVSFPAYPDDRNPAPGNHQQDIEARFMLGRGATAANRHVFWDAQAAYRSRFGAPADQIRFDVTGGIDVFPHVMLMGQIFNIWGMPNGDPLDRITNPNALSDFDLHKGQISLVFKTPRQTRIQLAWIQTLAGRNTGRGQTAVLAFWKDF